MNTASPDWSNNRPVAGLHLAQSDIIALHRLLRGEQPLLQGGGSAHVTADGDDAPVARRVDGEVADRYLAVAERVVDLTPARRSALAGIAQHLLDLAAAFTS